MKARRKPTIELSAPTLDENGDALPVSSETETETETETEMFAIPKKDLYGISMKNIASFKKLRQDYKLDNQKSVFLKDVSALLSHIPPSEHAFNVELLLQICNVAEEFYIYGDKSSRMASKLETVKEVMLPYFLDNEKLLDVMLHSIEHKIIKSTLFRRLFRRVKNYFF